ncbi:Gfo/Idh/MocA family oxidoreductase [Klebsiella pneumoniae]|nr:Gfo/Idh/MocA family oxidoreductase [Klebsiella pneumoniae]
MALLKAPPAITFLIGVLHRKDRWQVSAHLPPPGEARGAGAPQYSHIHFTSDLEEVLNDPLVKLVVVCTHADRAILNMRKSALEAGKNVLVEKPFTPTLEEAKTLFALGEQQRSDGDVLSEPPFRLKPP